MLLTGRCQVMLPNSCQCPNPVINEETNGALDQTKCLLHNQLNENKAVDETTQRANSVPASNTGE